MIEEIGTIEIISSKANVCKLLIMVKQINIVMQTTTHTYIYTAKTHALDKQERLRMFNKVVACMKKGECEDKHCD